MTIDTIKNVLMRIMTINQNLSEESLKTLLVASSWDEQDIKEGLNIYRELSKGVNIDEIQSITPQVKQEVKEEKRVTNEQPHDEVKVTAEPTDFIFPYNQGNKPQHAAILSVQKEVKKEEPAGSLIDSIASVLKAEVDQKDKIVTDVGEAFLLDVDPSKGTKKVDGEVAPNSSLITDLEALTLDQDKLPITNTYKYYKKPFGLILLDIALFITVLTLLVYIIFY